MRNSAACTRKQDDLVLRSGRLLKAMSLEYAPLMADLYWTRAVQYYGDKNVRHDSQLRFAVAAAGCDDDARSQLDSGLSVRFDVFERSPRRSGAGRPEQAIQLSDRGIRANPDYWRFYEDLGFIYYFELAGLRRRRRMRFWKAAKIRGADRG